MSSQYKQQTNTSETRRKVFINHLILIMPKEEGEQMLKLDRKRARVPKSIDYMKGSSWNSLYLRH